MKFLFLIALFSCCWAGASPALQVPAGFMIARAAPEMQLRYPIFAVLADDHRLFVAESSGLDLYAELQKLTRQCRISVLRDEDGDGIFDRATVFAENLVFPMGLAWRDGKLFVADPPDLVTLEDTDGDGRADRRTVLLTGFGHTDNGSLHGLTFGPDGWLYMTMGQPDGYHLKRADGSLLEGMNGVLLRCKPDGSNVELLARGFENLVEIVFMPGGEIIGTDNWFNLPADGIRDALVHLVPGGVYPLNAHVDRDRGKFFSGEYLPAVNSYPAVAQSGLMRYTSSAFPREMRDNLFSAEFNTRKIVRHQLSRKGATFQSLDEDFVWTDDPDFHPSDVLEDTDGSLLIVDTGSWYVQHCPTGRIRKTVAQGGLYRVRFNGPKSEKSLPTVDPALAIRRSQGPEDLLFASLKGPDAHIRLAAAEALANCGTSLAVPALVEALANCNGDPFLRHAYIYALHRSVSPDQLEKMFQHPSPEVRRAALIILDQAPHNRLGVLTASKALQDPDSTVRRAAIASFRKHSDWMPEAFSFAKTLASKTQMIPEEIAIARELLPFALDSAEVKTTIANGIADESRQPEARRLLLEISSNQKDTERFRKSIQAALRSTNETVLQSAVLTAQALRLGDLAELDTIGRNQKLPDGLRLQAVRAKSNLDAESIDFLLSRIALTNPPAVRLTAAEMLGAAALSDSQKEFFTETKNRDPLIGKRPGASASPEAIAEIEPLLKGGDPNRGQQLFLAKAGCAVCHRVGKQGGLAGPDLTRIGAIRAGRDLIESLVAPSATFAQGYEPFQVELTNGETLTGMRVRQPDDTFVLRDVTGAEIRLDPKQIKRIEPQKISLMPEGLLTSLQKPEIADLFAYLQSLK